MKKLTIITGAQGAGKTDYADKITKGIRTHLVNGKDVTIKSVASKTPYDCLVWDEFPNTMESYALVLDMASKIPHIILITQGRVPPSLQSDDIDIINIGSSPVSISSFTTTELLDEIKRRVSS